MVKKYAKYKKQHKSEMLKKKAESLPDMQKHLRELLEHELH